MDTDAGSDANSGVDWANANLTLEGLLSDMSAGDIGFVQGAATDTAAATRTLTSPGTITNPCKIIGVADGTTNEGASVVAGDLASTLVVISTTGGSSNFQLNGSASYSNIHLSSSNRILVQASHQEAFNNAKITINNDITAVSSKVVLNNTDLEQTASNARIEQGEFVMTGGAIISTVSTNVLDPSSTLGDKTFIGVDISGIGSNGFSSATTGTVKVKLKNCKVPSTFNFYSGATPAMSTTEAIGCSDTSSVAATDSIQDYQYEDLYGTIDLETTAVRTGGADDDATGGFSYAMTPNASAILESSGATLKSPWMSVWVDGGSNTLTVYIANDSASTDYNEDEAWVEFYTPDAGDTAQYDQTFDAGDARLLDSTTAITDDTGSTWGTGANNHQKFSATVTTGYTGWAYARLHLAKRSATPDTLFLDPRIVVS